MSITCEACGKKIDIGDFICGDPVNGGGLCIDCAPTYEDLRCDPSTFVNADLDPMTDEEAEAMIAEHIASGGSISDKFGQVL